MQSLFRLAWNQDPTVDKKPEKALLPQPKMRASPMVDIPPFLKMKRKRSQSSDHSLPSAREIVKKRKMLETSRPEQSSYGSWQSDAQTKPKLPDAQNEQNERPTNTPLLLSQSVPPAPISITTSPSLHETISSDNRMKLETKSPSTATKDAPPASAKTTSANSCDTGVTNSSTELRQIVEHQFNLEILLKHRELRLIDQELAKCQAALEQLRRCEVMPYPGSNSLSEDVSAGTGPSLKAQPGFSQPQSPAPWGVVDGPYTRHYSRWLLNDPAFDSVPAYHSQAPIDYFSTAPEGRSTRNSGASLGRTSKNRPSRDSVGNLSHALPNYPMQGRGKGGPLVIKRLADNQFVKLMCNNCQRGDFSSVQGFLNHCRIAHKVDYKSHEAAATDCGRPLEEDEAHLVPQSTPVATATPITVARTPGPRTTAALAQPPPPPAGLVHPLNAPVMPRYTWKVQAAAARATAAAAAVEVKRPPPLPSNPEPAKPNGMSNSSAAHAFHTAPLVASSSMPYLSTQFAKHGFGGDLIQATTRAREKIDFGPESMDDDQSSGAASRKGSVSAPSMPVDQASFTSDGTERPRSRKVQQTPSSRPRPSTLPTSSAFTPHPRGSVTEIPESPQEPDLSPHAADSNPGLVSDHEDDDAASDDEAHSERHASPGAPINHLSSVSRRIGACGPDAMDVDVEFEDDGDGHHGVLIRPRGLAFQEFSQRSGGSSSQRPVSRFGEAAK